MVFLLIVAVVAMVVVSGFLAASETAISALSRADLDELADESPRTGDMIRRIAAAPEAHANALTFTRVLLETMAAVLVTLILVDVFAFQWQAFLVAVAVMIVVSFVLTGASPRSVGRAKPELMLRISAWLARLVRVVMGPFASLLVRVGNRVTPGRPSRAGSVTSEEHLLSMVDEAAELEVLEDDDRERIHSVFAFSDRIVREVMVARTDMISVDADSTVGAAMTRFIETGISRAPVVGKDGDDVRGVLYFKDLAATYFGVERNGHDRSAAAAAAAAARAAVQAGPDAVGAPGGHGADGTLVEQLARPAIFVPETLPADQLLAQMQANANHFAMVVDEYGGIAGLVTLEDLIEELVGNISDEYDHDHDDVAEVEPGTFRVPSRLPTEELGDLFDVDIDEDEVDSVGGLLGKALGKVPERDDVAEIDGLRIEAERIGRRGRVTTFLVRRAAASAEEQPAGDDVSSGRAEIEAAMRRAVREDRDLEAGHSAR